jgi:hypothetical protein
MILLVMRASFEGLGKKQVNRWDDSVEACSPHNEARQSPFGS